MNARLLISKNILIPIAVYGFVFTFITITFDVTPLKIPAAFGSFLTYLAVMCSFVTVFVLMIDVFKNNLQSRYLWTLGFLVSGCFAGLYYLLKRDRLIPQA